MAVDGVNNSNNNTALYTAGAAVVGGGAGAAAGWYSRPFLKDGAPTDAFIKKIEENLMDKLPEEEKDAVKKAKKLIEEAENATNAEELKAALSKNVIFKQVAEAQGSTLEAGLSEIDAKGFEASKEEIKKFIKTGEDFNKEVYKGLFESSWDATAKKFKHNADAITQDGFNGVKKAARSIQTKYALIYGAIGAGVLGLGTLLCCGGKKEQPEQFQNVDMQA